MNGHVDEILQYKYFGLYMGFFDFLFGKTKDEPIQGVSSIDQVVKESVEHLEKCIDKVTQEKLEAEAINLASYIYLRKGGKIDFDLDYLTPGLMDKIPSGDFKVADQVFPLMIKYGSGGLYINKNAFIGKGLAYKANVQQDPEHHNFLKGYYKSVHKLHIDDPKPKVDSTSNNLKEERVDLGLPSGLLWATINIGASSPSEAGDYFAWGEKDMKDNYCWETYELCNGSYSSIFKYTQNDGKTILEPQEDVATSRLGKGWRIPTKEEMEELVDECKWTWERLDGQLGWKVTGKNGKSIFLPAAGAYSSYRIAGVGELGRYWTSTRDESNYSAYNLRFKDGRESIVVVDDTRFYGRPVRAVYGEAKKVKPQTTSRSQTTSRPQAAPQVEPDYKLNGLCELMIRQLYSSMLEGEIYAKLDQSIHKLPNGGMRIHQEEYGDLFNDFDFLGKNGWIRYVRIHGQILDAHYRTIGGSMEVFGLKVDNISRKPDYVECIINQSQFGR